MNSQKNPKARVIAFYLPQFHPIPENDKWWGKGFTEWTNVAKAKPLFKGHYQPRVPADLGFYDLRLPEVREQQAQMAREAGIEGFCYWHYWFSHDKKLLERPFQEVLQSGKPDFPFCLGWANHSWTNKHWEAGTRQQKEMTQEILAEKLHIVRQTVSKWEKGLSVPDSEMLVRLAEVFEVSVSELLGETSDFVPEKDSVAEQLALINEQLIIKNRRARRIWKVILVIFIAINLFIGGLLLLFMVDPESSTEEISESVEYIEE